MKKVLLLVLTTLVAFATPNCVALYGDTIALNECLKKIPKNGGNLDFYATTQFEVQRDPHIVKIADNQFCYREDISIKACVLISNEEALKAIRGYMN